MKIKRKEKKTLAENSRFFTVVTVSIIVICINLIMISGLVYVIISPRFDSFSNKTFIVLCCAYIINLVVLVFLLVLRKKYESFVNRKIIARLREIERHIGNFAHGNYDEPVLHMEDDEIGDLFKAVERVRVQLYDYREKEDNAAELKKNYISGLMHDIATPVTRINGCASMIEDGMVADEESIKRFATMILRNTEDINIMLKSLAAIEKYNDHGISMECQPVDIGEVLEIFFSDFNLFINDKSISIDFINKCKTPAVAMLDVKSCKRALANLINNSIKYKKPDCNCEIVVTLEDNPDGKILFSLADNGVGIEPGTENMIFEMFYRGDTARRNTNEGNGLGLFIAKQILNLNNIKLWAKNNGNGLTVFALFERSDKKPVRWHKREN